MLQTALRELEEEAGIFLMPEQLTQVGMLHFFREAKPEWNQDVHIFRGNYDGEFVETEEMLPKRFDKDKLPFDDMREDDILRMPKLIAGEQFDLDSHFDKEGKLK